ncbi:peptidylprolyl isomerase [Candidatus Woesearchaeota archaeon]|nr:peptidylprolyl isomerase [Candidatus Woesearchaeota archaeon]
MLQEKDFIELEYTGVLKSNGNIFDTTNSNLAKEKGIFNPKMRYEPIKICIGENHIIPGLDSRLLKVELNKETELEVPTEEAFGKKDPKLIMLISASKFKKENVRPLPGMQINVDNQIATVKSVNGGRVMVDFNHPLAGQDVIYKVKVLRKIEDVKEKVNAELTMLLNSKIETEVEKETAKVNLDLPKEISTKIEEKIIELIPEIKSVVFEKKDAK